MFDRSCFCFATSSITEFESQFIAVNKVPKLKAEGGEEEEEAPPKGKKKGGKKR